MDVNLAIDLLAQGIIFALFGHVKIYSVIVGCELVPFKELDCGLVELQNNYLVQQIEALNVALSRPDAVREVCDTRYFRLLSHEESTQ